MKPGDIDLELCSVDERRAIGMAAMAAFVRLCKDDPTWLPDMVAGGQSKSAVANAWRHSVVRQVTAGRAARVSELTRRDAPDVLARFASLAGQDVKAFAWAMKGGRAGGKAGRGRDTAAAVAGWRKKIATEGPAMGFNERWAHGYVTRVFKRAGVKSLDDANAAQLKACYVTMRSRWLAKQKSGVNPDA